MSKAELKRKIFAYDFAIHELVLYLDTHPTCKKGKALLEEYRRKRKELVMKRLISIIAAIVLPLMALAQPDIKVKAPNLVGINEQFRITFEIYGEDSPSDFSCTTH